jgi:hypothetical protein
MAQIKEEIIVIRLSQIVRDNADSKPMVTQEFIDTIESVVQEMVNDASDSDTIVEIVTGDE